MTDIVAELTPGLTAAAAATMGSRFTASISRRTLFGVSSKEPPGVEFRSVRGRSALCEDHPMISSRSLLRMTVPSQPPPSPVSPFAAAEVGFEPVSSIGAAVPRAALLVYPALNIFPLRATAVTTGAGAIGTTCSFACSFRFFFFFFFFAAALMLSFSALKAISGPLEIHLSFMLSTWTSTINTGAELIRSQILLIGCAGLKIVWSCCCRRTSRDQPTPMTFFSNWAAAE